MILLEDYILNKKVYAKKGDKVQIIKREDEKIVIVQDEKGNKFSVEKIKLID